MIELDVKEMTCGGCVRAVTKAVNTVDPEAKVEVHLETGRVLIDSQRPSTELIAALQEAGYPSAVANAKTPVAAEKKTGCCCK